MDLISRHISGNWYSIIVNGQRHGFFKSENELRQGDPIPPSLFVISAELLSTMLNNLHDQESFSAFAMNKRGPRINHLAFADDLILFITTRKKTVKKMMKVLTRYENISGQMVNKVKSCFILVPGIANNR